MMPSNTNNLPHTISVVHHDGVQANVIPCDLATLTVGHLYQHVASAFNSPVETFDLMHLSTPLANDEAVKAIDVGLSNNMFLIMQPKGASAYPPAFDMAAPHQAQGHPQHSHVPPHGHTHPHMPHHMQHISPSMMPSQAPYNTSPHMMPHNVPLPMNTSPQMMPQMMGVSPPVPVSPLSDPYLEQYDIALAQTLSSQMQLNAVLNNFTHMSPSSSPTSMLPPSSLPMPVSPPPMRELSAQRIARPTGSVNLNSMDLCAYAMTNEGSRATVAAIEELEEPKALSAKIAELASKFGMVASHQHGSKVVRALLKKADVEQKCLLLQTGCGFLEELCESNTGSDVFVEVIQCVRDDDVPIIVGAIIGAGPAIAKSINGRKIIVAVLNRWTEHRPQDVEPIFDMVGQNLVQLAQDQTGCVTIQRCLDNAKDMKLKTQMQMQIMSVAEYLFTDMYGNYVLQHAIKGQEIYGEILAGKLEGKVSELAINKYSSCVIEKVLVVVGDKAKVAIIEEVLADLQKLMWDGFGNFVVQSAVDYAPVSMLERLKGEISPYINDCPYGYRIDGKLNKRVKKNGRRPAQHAGYPRQAASQERSVSPEMQMLSMLMNGQPVPAPACQPVAQATSPQQLALQMSRLGLTAQQQTKPGQKHIVAAP